MKKKFKMTTAIIICGLLIAIVYLVGTKSYYQSKFNKESEIENIVSQSQYIVNALKIIDDLEDKGIEVDPDYEKLIEEKGLDIVNNYDIRDWEVLTIGEVLYINEKCNGTKKGKIKEKLDAYYVEDKMIFSQYPYKNYDQDMEEEYENIWITLTITKLHCKQLEVRNINVRWLGIELIPLNWIPLYT